MSKMGSVMVLLMLPVLVTTLRQRVSVRLLNGTDYFFLIISLLARDSVKDEVIVHLFLFITFVLIVFSLFKPWIDKWTQVK